MLWAGVEKENDDMRRYFHRKCNRWDSCRQILLVEKIEEVLEDVSKKKKGRLTKGTPTTGLTVEKVPMQK